MNEINNELIKDKNEFTRVVRKIQASGITDDEEISEIMLRDHRHLIREPTKAEKEKAVCEMKASLIEKVMADLNRESIKENGHPFVVCQRIDGVKQFKTYESLTQAEIAELKATGIIL
jgi:hypothetical protein